MRTRFLAAIALFTPTLLTWPVYAQPCGVTDAQIPEKTAKKLTDRILKADVFLKQGRSSKNAGKSEEADGLFKKALSELAEGLKLQDCNPVVLYKQGEVNEALDRWDDSYASYTRAGTVETTSPNFIWDNAKKDAETAVVRLRPTIEIDITHEEGEIVMILLDEKSWPQPVEPGKRTIVIKGEGLRPFSETKELHAGGKPWPIKFSTKDHELLAPRPPALSGEAGELFDEGRELVDGDGGVPPPQPAWEKAYASFHRVLDLRPGDRHALYNRARCLLAMNRISEARRDFDDVIQGERSGDVPSWMIVRAKRFSGEIEQRMATVVLALKVEAGTPEDNTARIKVDGAPLHKLSYTGGQSIFVVGAGASAEGTRIRDGYRILLEPGKHEIAAERPGFLPSRKSETWNKPGEAPYTIELRRPPPPPPPDTGRYAGYTLIALGGASAIVGGVLQGIWHSDYDTANTLCTDEACGNEVLAAKRDAETMSWAFPTAYAIAGASLIAGVFLVWAPWRDDPAAPSITSRTTLRVGPTSLSMQGAF